MLISAFDNQLSRTESRKFCFLQYIWEKILLLCLSLRPSVWFFFPSPSSNKFIFHFCVWQHWREILCVKQSWVYHHFLGVFLAFCNTLTPPALPTPASRRSWNDPMPCWRGLCWDQSCFQCEGRWECSGERGWHLVSGEGAVYPFIFSLLFCLTHV